MVVAHWQGQGQDGNCRPKAPLGERERAMGRPSSPKPVRSRSRPLFLEPLESPCMLSRRRKHVTTCGFDMGSDEAALHPPSEPSARDSAKIEAKGPNNGPCMWVTPWSALPQYSPLRSLGRPRPRRQPGKHGAGPGRSQSACSKGSAGGLRQLPR